MNANAEQLLNETIADLTRIGLDAQAQKLRDARTDEAALVASLRVELVELRAELDALRAELAGQQRTAP